MYHLKLTIILILKNSTRPDIKLTVEDMKRKDRMALKLGILITVIFALTSLAHGVINFIKVIDNSAKTVLFVFCFVKLGIFLIVSIFYIITTCSLYVKVQLIDGMDDEKNAIIKQALAFAGSLTIMVSMQSYKGSILINMDPNDQEASKDTAFQLALADSIMAPITKGIPLIYLLLTHMKTY